MPVLQFKGRTAVECYHHTVPHHVLKCDPKLSVLTRGQKPGLDANLIIEGDNLLALKALLPTHAGRIKGIYMKSFSPKISSISIRRCQAHAGSMWPEIRGS